MKQCDCIRTLIIVLCIAYMTGVSLSFVFACSSYIKLIISVVYVRSCTIILFATFRVRNYSGKNASERV